jgi:hypothetical protein
MKKIDYRSYASILCEYFSTKPAIEADLARDAFATTVCPTANRTLGHTHAAAAALRTSATTFATSYVAYMGSSVFSIGMSKSDQRKQFRGTRQWYWAKDVHAENRIATPTQGDTLYLCDVDYYVDMPALLNDHFSPVLLYTVVPEEACSSNEDDTSFFFDTDANLVTRINGGGSYRHPLWDYGADSTLVVDWMLCIPTSITSYAIERKQVAKHRQIVLITPIKRFHLVGAILAYFLLDSKPLCRFNPITKCPDGSIFVRYNVQRNDGLYVTTARPESYVCATIPAGVDASIATVSRLGKTALMLPTTASWVKDDRAAAAVLTEYFRVAAPCSHPYVFPVEKAVRSYQYKPDQYDQDAQPKLQAFMSPFIHAAFVPIANKAGEERCVEGRIDSLKKPEPNACRFRDKCLQEFTDIILDGINLEPVCYDVVADKQTSATQKQSLLKASLTGLYRKMILKCFIKAEAYLDVKDPRNISTYNDADKLDMAMFALSLSEHLKQFPWYGPGKTPLEIAERVTEICSDAAFVNISDYHRMDGTISGVMRQVDRVICMKAFANHRVKLNEILKSNYGNVGYLPEGTTFEQGTSHGSGCSATSLFQTLRSVFTAFLAFRRHSTNTCKNTNALEDFQKLGIHLGDDGVDAGLPISAHEWAAKRVGLIVEAHVVHRGERGVNFLARYYSPEVWNGSPDSMCDPKRQLSKFHTTIRLPAGVTPAEKLVEKAMSYVATDANTPIIGAFCTKALTMLSFKPTKLHGVGNWWSKFERSVQYPNENVQGWMDVEFSHHLPLFDRDLFKDWLEGATTVEELLSPPLCQGVLSPTAKHDVVVDDEVLLFVQSASQQAPIETNNTEGTQEKRETNKRNTSKQASAITERAGQRSTEIRVQLRSGDARILPSQDIRRTGIRSGPITDC